MNECQKCPACWKSGDFRIFISHVSTCKDVAVSYQAAFADYGMKAFVAHEDIEPATLWQQELETALQTMNALIAILTHGFHASKWTDQEVGHALGLGVPVVSVSMDAAPYGFIGKHQAYKGFSQSVPEIVEKIVTRLVSKGDECGSRATTAVCQAIGNASSYQHATMCTAMLEKCPILAAKDVEILEAALDGNGQVKGAWEVPERIRANIDFKLLDLSD